MRAQAPNRYEEPPLKPIIEPPDYVPPSLQGLERVAWLMDRAFRVPGTPIRVGLDAIIGLLPVGGDMITGAIQAGIVMVAMSYYKVPKAIAARMVANVLLDITLGSIPLVGDVFDAFFKANTRNMQLLTEVHRQQVERKTVSTAPSILYLVGVGLAFAAILSLLLVGFVVVLIWLYKQTVGA